MTSELERREAELEAELDRRKTTSQRQSDALRAPRAEQDDDSKSLPVSHRQANALRGQIAD